MIAASILLGRADFQWPALQRALEGRRALAGPLSKTPELPEPMPLPAPDPPALRQAGQPLLAVHAHHVGAPGVERPAVRGASFELPPGSAVGIAGPSASGKSTLARALAGMWPAWSGTVMLVGTALEHYGESAPARHLGWLPREVVLFAGTAPKTSRVSIPIRGRWWRRHGMRMPTR